MIIPVEHFFMGDHLYNMMTSPVCKKYGLTHMEFTVLIFLANNKRYDTATDIIRLRKLTKSHVSVSVRSLEEKGLLTCRHEGSDRRTVHLKLTPSAESIVRDGRLAQESFFKTLFTGFTQEEKAKLDEFMLRIDTNIKDGIIKAEEETNGR